MCLRGQGGYAKALWLAALRCKGYGVVMAGLRAGHARPLQGGVNELRAKARPTECGKVGCRAVCPQAAADVCGNEKPCGLCCRGGGVPDAPRRCGVVSVGPRLSGAKSGSEQCLPLQGKQPHERASFAG